MSGASRCRKFLRDLDVNELKAINVRIKNLNASGPESTQPIFRELDDPKKLVIHFKREELRGIFDRKDILINQECNDDKRCSRSPSEDSVSSEEIYIRKKTVEGDRRRRDSAWKSKDDGRIHYRSKSRSTERYRRASPQYIRARSHSTPSTERRRKSRSLSPSKAVKKPGLYIPPKSDYLRYEKKSTRKRSRSASPIASCSGYHPQERKHSTRSPPHHKYSSHKSRSPHSALKRSTSRQSSPSPERFKRRKSTSPARGYERHREERSSVERIDRYKKGKATSPSHHRSSQGDRSRRSRSAHRRSRTPTSRSSYSKNRRSRSRSPSRRNKEYRSRRSRSSSRHRDRELEYLNASKPPYIFQDGEYWIAAGALPKPGFFPRGYLPPPLMYPRGYGPPMIMPRMPMPMMQPYRPRIFRPRAQAHSSNATLTNSEVIKVSNTETEQTSQQTEVTELQHETVTNETVGVTITEIPLDTECANNSKPST